jgi:type IV secretion system protein VirB8
MNWFKILKPLYKNKRLQSAKLAHSPPDYFQTASSWADDLSSQIITSRNRYRILYWTMVVLVMLLAINLLWLIPRQTLQPFLVHHYENGYTQVEPLREPAAPAQRAQVEADLVRYIWHRESYARAIYHVLYPVVEALSSKDVLKNYVAQESVRNPTAHIHQLGIKGKRNIIVESIVFLDNAHLTPTDLLRDADIHHHVAQVQFHVTQTLPDGEVSQTAWLAMISWEYRGTPKHVQDRWQNWNGFTVTHYETHPRQGISKGAQL